MTTWSYLNSSPFGAYDYHSDHSWFYILAFLHQVFFLHFLLKNVLSLICNQEGLLSGGLRVFLSQSRLLSLNSVCTTVCVFLSAVCQIERLGLRKSLGDSIGVPVSVRHCTVLYHCYFVLFFEVLL